MDFDNSFKALSKPGEATEFFDLGALPRIDPQDPGYSGIHAWWLGELSRAIYKPGPGEPDLSLGPTRQQVFQQAGFTEIGCFDSLAVQGALVESRDLRGEPFGVLIFRGTDTIEDWIVNFKAFPMPWEQGGWVHGGFGEALAGAWDKIYGLLSNFRRPVLFTGHSLGGALATLAASKWRPLALYTFGAPFAGNGDFVKTLEGAPIYRVVNNRDIVPKLPPSIGPLQFRHAGDLHFITSDNRMRVNPGGEAAEGFRLSDLGEGTPINQRQWLIDLPEFMTDHSPVNYVAHLERLLPPRLRGVEET